jgi:hypothetical protein
MYNQVYETINVSYNTVKGLPVALFATQGEQLVQKMEGKKWVLAIILRHASTRKWYIYF